MTWHRKNRDNSYLTNLMNRLPTAEYIARSEVIQKICEANETKFHDMTDDELLTALEMEGFRV